jgi:hypothetical protein
MGYSVALAFMVKGWGNIHIAINSYFDGSHSGEGWHRARFITLAGFAIDDSLLEDFNHNWNAVLGDDSHRPVTQYLHLRELRKREGAFGTDRGWTDELRGRLIIDLLQYLQTVDKKRCRMFTCSVDRVSHE